MNSKQTAFANSSSFVRRENVSSIEKEARCGRKNHLGGEVSPQMSYCQSVSRRAFIKYLSFSSLILGHYSTPRTAQALSSPFARPEDLAQRLKARIAKEPAPKLYQRDIFYPEYFSGTWRTESTLLAVQCPAGYKLFGRPGSFESVKEEVDRPLFYQSRFIHSGNDVISDRPFNVTSIARASMGASSVLDCTPVGSNPNRLTMTLRPNAAEGALFNVDLRIIARQQQVDVVPNSLEGRFFMEQPEVDNEQGSLNRNEFGLYTSETMRQEVRPSTDDLRVMPVIKNVETITVFVTNPRDEAFIRGWQKTSVYLTKSDFRYPDARGKPIDVRWYRLKYFKQ